MFEALVVDGTGHQNGIQLIKLLINLMQIYMISFSVDDIIS